MKLKDSNGPFGGFGRELFAFFDDLAENQSREWFQANKPRYEAGVLAPFRSLIEALNEEFAAREIPLEGDPKRSIMRINRDVRFTPDKRPYKTNASAMMTRQAGTKSPGMLYIHLSPKESFIAAGFHAMEKPDLDAMRSAIADDQSEWLRRQRDLEKSGHPIDRDDSLKRLPRGFDPEQVLPVADALKLRSFFVKRTLTREEVETDALVDLIASFAESSLSLLLFGWAAIG